MVDPSRPEQDTAGAGTVTEDRATGSDEIPARVPGQRAVAAALPAPATPAPGEAAPRGGGRARFLGLWDALAMLAYLALALYVNLPLWRPGGTGIVGDGTDQGLYEWMLANAARDVTHLHNPLFTHQLNYPAGGNIIANASALGLTLPATPLTLLLGASATFAVLRFVAFAATAAGWYLLLRRHVVDSRWAALLGGGLAAFGPGMISESLGHLHIISQFLVPWMIHVVIRICRTGRARHAILLGVLVAWQALISEEVLLLAAVSGTVVLLGWLALRVAPRVPLRHLLMGATVAVPTAVALLAYPLWFQFFGPQHFDGLTFDPSGYAADVAAYPSFSDLTLTGRLLHTTSRRLAQNWTEQTTYLGWPLLACVAALVLWRWRERRVWVLGGAAGLVALLSLGPGITVNGRPTGHSGPDALPQKLPLFDMLLPTRYGLVVCVLVAVLLAIGVDRLVTVLRQPAPAGRLGGLARPAAATGLLASAVALGLLVPAPIPTRAVPPVPAFFADGTWRRYVPAGRTVVPVPLPTYLQMDGMRWSTRALAGFPMPEGFLIVPDAATGRAVWYVPPRPTAAWFEDVAASGRVHAAAPGDATLLRADLAYWRAAVLVLDPAHAHAEQLRDTLVQFLGQPQDVGGVWLWDVRPLVP